MKIFTNTFPNYVLLDLINYNLTMMIEKSLWIFTLLICSSLCFVVDHNNYFYLNTSYAKQTISFSMNFKVSQPTQLKLISPILIPQGNHILISSLQKDKNVSFDNAFNNDVILYNSYEDGEHWYGVKIKYQNSNKYDFARLEVHLRQQTNITAYVFLAPLFRLPLNAIQVFPSNTLYACHQSVLLSYSYSHSEVDFYAIARKDTAKAFKVDQKKDWGFFRQDFTANYLRHKSKSNTVKQVTLNYSNADGQIFQCRVNKQSTFRQKIFQIQAQGIRIEQLLSSSIQLNARVVNQNVQL